MKIPLVPRVVREGAHQGIGSLAQIVNLSISRLESLVPERILAHALSDTDTIVLQNVDARRGAALVNRFFGRPGFAAVDYDALREARPLLGSTSLDVASSNAAHRLEVSATAAGADWGNVTGRSGNVAVYVDGTYHSDLIVLSERAGDYHVNLAGLAPGRHDVELRWSGDLAGAGAIRPEVSAVTTGLIEGDDALIARYAPIIQSRAARVRPGGVSEQPLSTDIPMLLSPTVEALPGGGTRITYDLLFSNEDGGIPVTQAYKRLGRTIDQEIAYRVDLDAAGNRVKDMFQGPLHVPYQYKGERVGDRPILTIATRNNLFTARPEMTAPRWSEVPVVATTRRPTDRELLIDHPWTTAIMGKELLAEGKVNPTHPRSPVHDARRYLFLAEDDPARTALKKTGTLHLRLNDGTVVPMYGKDGKMLIKLPFMAQMGTAVLLPEHITSDQIAGVSELAGSSVRGTFVLGTDYQSRALGG